jgi:hypothetical protein
VIEHVCPRLMLLDEDYIYFKILNINYTYTSVLLKGLHHTSWDMDQVLGILLNGIWITEWHVWGKEWEHLENSSISTSIVWNFDNHISLHTNLKNVVLLVQHVELRALR